MFNPTFLKLCARNLDAHNLPKNCTYRKSEHVMLDAKSKLFFQNYMHVIWHAHNWPTHCTYRKSEHVMIDAQSKLFQNYMHVIWHALNLPKNCTF